MKVVSEPYYKNPANTLDCQGEEKKRHTASLHLKCELPLLQDVFYKIN